MSKKNDIHLHTPDSDGRAKFTEIVDQALLNDVDLLVVTNHETLTLNRLDEYQEIASNYRIIVPFEGVEVTTVTEIYGQPIMFDVLCYGHTLVDAQFNELLEASLKFEYDYYDAHLQKIAWDFGVDIPGVRSLSTYEENNVKYPSSRVTRRILWQNVTHLTSISYDEFKQMVPKRLPVDAPIDTNKLVGIVSELGGVSVIAHPIKSLNHLEQSHIRYFIDKMISLHELGLNGIEVNHRSHNLDTRSMLSHMCKNIGVIPTGGSDFHGRNGEFIGSDYTEDSSFEALFADM